MPFSKSDLWKSWPTLSCSLYFPSCKTQSLYFPSSKTQSHSAPRGL